MRLLLDTHALIWWTSGLESLPRSVRRAIADPDNVVYVSAITAMEITIKFRLGKLPEAELLARTFEEQVAEEGFVGLPLTVRHGQLAGSLAIQHKDPFDRMLIAQAIIEDLTFVSNEKMFDASGVSRLW